MSDYTIFGKTEDGSRQRVFYTIEIAPFRFVDVMCIRNTSENYEYLMQNGDGSYVYYEGEYTYPGYPFDERKCLNLAADQYAKDYYSDNAQKEKWVLTLSEAMTMDVPEEHKKYVKEFLFDLFKKQPNSILNHFACKYQVADREEMIQKILQKLHKNSEGLVSEILDLTFSAMIPEGLDDHVTAALRQLPNKELRNIVEKYQL